MDLDIENQGDGNHKPLSFDEGSSKLLPHDFVPGTYDVYCGRGTQCFHHIGNQIFRHLIADMLDEYSHASSKYEKSRIIDAVVNTIRQQTPYGGFIKKDYSTGRYQEVGDFIAREKTSQAFRDALQSKTKRRKATLISKESNRPRKAAKLDISCPGNNKILSDSVFTRALERKLAGNLNKLDRIAETSLSHQGGPNVPSANKVIDDTSQFNDDVNQIAAVELPSLLSLKKYMSHNFTQPSSRENLEEFNKHTSQSTFWHLDQFNTANENKEEVKRTFLPNEDAKYTNEIHVLSSERCFGERHVNDELDFHTEQPEAQVNVTEDSITFELLFHVAQTYMDLNDPFPYEPNQLPLK